MASAIPHVKPTETELQANDNRAELVNQLEDFLAWYEPQKAEAAEQFGDFMNSMLRIVKEDDKEKLSPGDRENLDGMTELFTTISDAYTADRPKLNPEELQRVKQALEEEKVEAAKDNKNRKVSASILCLVCYAVCDFSTSLYVP